MAIKDGDIESYPEHGEGAEKIAADGTGLGFEGDEGSILVDGGADGSPTVGADSFDVVIADGHGPADSATGSGVGGSQDGGADGPADVGAGGSLDGGADAAPGPGPGDSGTGIGEPGVDDGGADSGGF